MSLSAYDLVVIGGGPGGYPGAIRAAQRGLRVAIVEAEHFGGECTNYGCIPTKALLMASIAVFEAKRWGGEAKLDPSVLAEKVESVVKRVRGGIEHILESYGVEIVKGIARIKGEGRVAVESSDSRFTLEYKALLLAPGSMSWSPPGLEPTGVRIVDNRGVLRDYIRNPPRSLLVVGGGPVGVEFAQVFAALGTSVTVAEMMPRLLPGMDKDLGIYARRLLTKHGVKVKTNCRVESLEERGNGVRAKLCGREEEYEAVLVAIGRTPRTHGLGLENIGVETDEKGFIRTNEYLETTTSNVYASGDATGHPMLAHKAIHQSLIAADNIALGRKVKYDASLIPLVVYGAVELAQVGIVSAKDAKEKGFNVGETRVRLGSVGYAVAAGAEDGFAKIIYDRETGRLLGASIAAPHSSDIIAAVAVAIAAGMNIEEASNVVYPHPAACEAFIEALMAAKRLPLHYIVPRH